jgi:hypothetical protein
MGRLMRLLGRLRLLTGRQGSWGGYEWCLYGYGKLDS